MGFAWGWIIYGAPGASTRWNGDIQAAPIASAPGLGYCNLWAETGELKPEREGGGFSGMTGAMARREVIFGHVPSRASRN
jgi:hypothetical protein